MKSPIHYLYKSKKAIFPKPLLILLVYNDIVYKTSTKKACMTFVAVEL